MIPKVLIKGCIKMAVNEEKYAKEYEKAIAAGKSASDAHKSASGSSKAEKPSGGKKPDVVFKGGGKNWVQKLKEKVGVTLKPEKERRQNMEVKRQVNENKLKAAGKKSTKELEQKYKTENVKKKKKTTRTQQVESGLKNAGLTDAEIAKLQRKK